MSAYYHSAGSLDSKKAPETPRPLARPHAATPGLDRPWADCIAAPAIWTAKRPRVAPGPPATDFQFTGRNAGRCLKRHTLAQPCGSPERKRGVPTLIFGPKDNPPWCASLGGGAGVVGLVAHDGSCRDCSVKWDQSGDRDHLTSPRRPAQQSPRLPPSESRAAPHRLQPRRGG